MAITLHVEILQFTNKIQGVRIESQNLILYSVSALLTLYFLTVHQSIKENVMKKEFKLTKDGIAELNAELTQLNELRVEVIDAIKTARDQGDLSENAEYHSAKEEQERVDNRIDEINHILHNAEVVKKSAKSSVGIGNEVTLKSGKKPIVYNIVDSVEANPLEAKISDKSPIGQALMGKKVGEKVVIELPAGKTTYEIQAIA